MRDTVERSLENMKRLVLVLLLTLFASSGGRAEVCIPGQLKLASLTGNVISTAGVEAGPVAEATVELFSRLDLGEPIESVRTATDGSFGFTRSQPGRYVVRVSRVGFYTFDVPVKLVKRSVPRSTLIINLGVSGVSPCGGSWARVALNGS